ncbi:MAG: toll/interleukin-1 receptor domain-containing protein [Candidatus Thiodiazotropha sp. (ex Codakia orbicularis)]|nr:toll/interleukin-1 receptor domain-containing protein [Candidatus Thiodiazotropha sp. (ex Codakia orbicularis)]
MLKLFVSHSSKTEASKQLLLTICNKLQANDNGCYVLVDKSGDIYPSDDWEKRLDEWLSECHAAVLLVTEAALKSWWVLKEATILKFRWGRDPNFKRLFIVLLDDLESTVFRQGRYKILNLDRVQFLTSHDNDPDRIVAKIETELANIEPCDTWFDRMKGSLSSNLRKVDSPMLTQTCHDLEVEKRLGEMINWSGSENTPHADALARLILREHYSSLCVYNDVIDAIDPPLHHDSAQPLYETVYPLWINAEAAAMLPLACDDTDSENKRLAINGKRLYKFTAESFVRRSYPFSIDWELIPIDKTHTDAKMIAAEVRDYFRKRITGDSDSSDENTDEEIRDFPSPIYILLAENLTDDSILDELQGLYPNVVFLLSMGISMPGEEAIPAKARPISPTVDIELEKQQNNQMNRARSLLNKLPGAPHQ